MEKHFSPKYNYVFYTDQEGRKVVIAISSFGGRTVQGKAVCAADDTYDEEFGKELARLRCALKIENKRQKFLIEMCNDMRDEATWVLNTYRQYYERLQESVDNANQLNEQFDALVEHLKK